MSLTSMSAFQLLQRQLTKFRHSILKLYFDDEATVNAAIADIDTHEKHIEDLEFRRMFAGELDANNAFLDIQAGSDGTRALLGMSTT